jgi:integration host factor subunit alpha
VAHTDLTPRPGQTRQSGDGDPYSALQQSAFSVDVHRAMPVDKARDDADGDLPTLTKAELAELVFENVGLNKREAKDMVGAFFNEISDALARAEAVKLSGFGNFQLRDKVSRPGRNPKTGVQVNIPARRVVTFHASQKLKIVADDSAILGIPGIPEHVDVNDRG